MTSLPLAMVTGAARGIGRQIAMGLSSEGFAVACVDRLDCAATRAALPGPGAAYRADISRESEVRRTVEKIEKQGPVAVLVNNAALYGGLRLTPTLEMPVREWDRVMAVNVRGAFLCSKWVIAGMQAAGRGKIINVASGSALRGSPFLLHYVSSKGALIAMTRALASELGVHNIQVNAVAPGFISNEASRGLDPKGKIARATLKQQCLKRPLQSRDVVGTVLYLASPWSDAVTGQVIPVDGGLVKR